MRKTDKRRLLELLEVEFSEVAQRGNRLLISTSQNLGHPGATKMASWDRYFTDLSFGSFTPLVQRNRRTSRSRAWHFALKNMALVKQVLCDPRRELDLLDLGCSSGYLRRFLEGNLPERRHKLVYYCGLDARLEPLRSATVDTKHVESGASGNRTPSIFVHHDVNRGLPFTASRFHVIVAFEFIKYLDRVAGLSLLKEVRRVCHPKGYLTLSMPTSFEYERKAHPLRMAALEPNELIDLLTQAGFRIEGIKGSQSTFAHLKNAITDNHREAFEALARLLPEEVVAAFFAPLYPKYSTQLTYLCRPL